MRRVLSGGGAVALAEHVEAGRNGHVTPCPGCADLSVAMRRSLAEHELLITVRRLGAPKEHLESCVMGLVLKELATRMIP